MKRSLYTGIIVGLLGLFATQSCSKEEKDNFVRGADIGWITEIEDKGEYELVDTDGRPAEAHKLLKDLDINAIRIRVWVNPSPSANGKTYIDIKDAVKKAVRAKEAGMEVMIDFHYSNWWADPSKQFVPREWHAEARQHEDSIGVICDSVRQHTIATLTALKVAGVTPKWVQIGNEIPNGFMHPYGIPTEHPDWFAQLFQSGYEAAKEVFPGIICIAHIDNGYDLARTTFILDILEENNVPFDLLGWSLYPAMNWVTMEVDTNWVVKVDQCIANADSIFIRYGKESMLVEVGMPDIDEHVGAECIDYIIHNHGEHLHGLMWWEPLATPDYHYGMGALKQYEGNKYGPNEALKAFKKKR